MDSAKDNFRNTPLDHPLKWLAKANNNKNLSQRCWEMFMWISTFSLVQELFRNEGSIPVEFIFKKCFW